MSNKAAALAALQIENDRAQRFIEDALAETQAEIGDPRLFALALLDQAAGLFVKIEGPDPLLRTLARMAAAHQVAGGRAGRA
jgi:hypothetical protein